MLNTAIAGLEEIAQGAAGSAPDLSQAVAHQKLGDIFESSVESRMHADTTAGARSLTEGLLAEDPDDPPTAENLYQTCMGRGLLSMATKQYGDAKVEFARAVVIAEVIAAGPSLKGGREGLIEAYLQVGRAYSFLHEFDRGGRVVSQDAGPGSSLGVRGTGP